MGEPRLQRIAATRETAGRVLQSTVGKGKKEPTVEAKKAPKKKEEPKEEQDGVNLDFNKPPEPPAQEATEPGESQPSIEVEATVAADLPQNQNKQEEPAAPAGPEPAAEPEPAQPPEAARANLSFGWARGAFCAEVGCPLSV